MRGLKHKHRNQSNPNYTLNAKKVRVMRGLEHKNLVSLLDYFEDKQA